MSYHSSITIKYKTGYIFVATIDGHEITRVQVDKYAYTIQVKSIRAAQIMITKHANKITGVTL